MVPGSEEPFMRLQVSVLFVGAAFVALVGASISAQTQGQGAGQGQGQVQGQPPPAQGAAMRKSCVGLADPARASSFSETGRASVR